MTTAAACGCQPLAADSDLCLAWKQAAEAWNPGKRKLESRWLRNTIANDFVVFSCGQLSSGTENHPLHEPGEGQRCASLARQCASALASVNVVPGDESDHSYEPFSAPAVRHSAPLSHAAAARDGLLTHRPGCRLTLVKC